MAYYITPLGVYLYVMHLKHETFMNKLTPLIYLVLCLFLPISAASEKNNILPITPATITIPSNIHYLTMGPRLQGKSLRVSIVVEEIYPSIFIEEITFGDVEGDPDIVTNSYFLSGFEVVKKLGGKKWSPLNNINLIKWHKWNEFEAKHIKTKFKIIYNSKNNFNIEIIK